MVFILFTLLLVFGGCSQYEKYQKHDPYLKLSKEEFEKLLAADTPKAPAARKPRKPQPPRPPPIPAVFKTPVSISLSEDVPLKASFMTLAQQIGVNIALDPAIQGGLFFHAKNRPFIEVIEDICSLSKLKFSLHGNTIRIEPDIPYWQDYDLQFLSLARQHKNRISSSTDIFSGNDQAPSGLENGSNVVLSADTNVDFWGELQTNLDKILNPVVHKDPSLNLTYSLHRQSGIVSVYAPQTVQKQVCRFIDNIQHRTGKQVLIEAKILEINLSDEFKTGINWHALSGKFAMSAPFGDISDVGPFQTKDLTQDFAKKNIFKIGTRGKSLTAMANFLNNFGTVRTLSSPRLTVLNNQPALLKVATNKVFFRIHYEREPGRDNKEEVQRSHSEIHTVPIGLILLVHPAIHSDSGKIMLMVRPSITRILGEKADPSVGFMSKQTVISKVPEVQVREMDSVLMMNTGETIIMGGLMQERGSNDRSGLPVDDVPIFDQLWSSHSKKQEVTEIVVLLRATILDDGIQTYSNTDEHLYKVFTRDTRPLHFQRN